MKNEAILTKSILAALLITISMPISAKRPHGAENGFFNAAGKGFQKGNRNGLMPNGPAFFRARQAIQLDLSEEQREQIKTIRQDAQNLIQPLADQIVANRLLIKELVKADDYDAAQVQTLADQQGDLFSQLIVIKANSKASIRGLLSDEQKAILDEMKSKAED